MKYKQVPIAQPLCLLQKRDFSGMRYDGFGRERNPRLDQSSPQEIRHDGCDIGIHHGGGQNQPSFHDGHLPRHLGRTGLVEQCGFPENRPHFRFCRCQPKGSEIEEALGHHLPLHVIRVEGRSRAVRDEGAVFNVLLPEPFGPANMRKRGTAPLTE